MLRPEKRKYEPKCYVVITATNEGTETEPEIYAGQENEVMAT